MLHAATGRTGVGTACFGEHAAPHPARSASGRRRPCLTVPWGRARGLPDARCDAWMLPSARRTSARAAAPRRGPASARLTRARPAGVGAVPADLLRGRRDRGGQPQEQQAHPHAHEPAPQDKARRRQG